MGADDVAASYVDYDERSFEVEHQPAIDEYRGAIPEGEMGTRRAQPPKRLSSDLIERNDLTESKRDYYAPIIY